MDLKKILKMKKFRIKKHTKYHTSLESSRREEYEFDILSQVLFSCNLLGLIYYTQINRYIILTYKKVERRIRPRRLGKEHVL